MFYRRTAGNNESPAIKTIAQIVLVVLSVLLAGAIIFYKERMLFIDGPHNLFRIINDGHLEIEEHRYGSFISQILPLAAVKCHIPLKWLMIIYSASFNLFFLGVAALLVYKFKNYGLAILSGLYYTLFVSDTFYWPNNEVHQGISWLLLAFAAYFFLTEKGRHTLATILFLPLFYLAIWTHPLIIPVSVYLWFFFMGKTYSTQKKQYWIICSIILLALAGVKFYQGMHHGYDSTKIEVVTGFKLSDIKTIFTSAQFKFFIHGCITNYWLVVLLFIAGFVALLREKKYLLLVWTVGCAVGYVILISITFRDVNRFYIESEYMPLTIICCTPFVYYALPRLNRQIGSVAMIGCFMVRLLYIYSAAPLYTNRLVLLDKINEKMKEKHLTKVIITEPAPFADYMLIMNWGAPVESIILSQLKGEHPQRTFLFANPSDTALYKTTGRDTLIGCWERRGPAAINSYYFQIDTGSNYQVMDFGRLIE